MDDGIVKKLKWQLILWLARRLPDCRRVTRSLGESLDRKPSFRERIVLRLHLFTCEACALYLKQIKFLREALCRHGTACEVDEEMTHTTLSRESKERIKSVLRRSIGLAF